MKIKIALSILVSVFAITSIAETLPAPQTVGGMPLMQAISERKSVRDYDYTKPVTKQDLSNILWAAWGITHDGKHTVATAMNRQELLLYVITDHDISLYDPAKNTLTVVNTGDFRELAGRQEFAQKAPINVVMVADTEKQNRLEFQAYTAGAASQNMYLYCASAGLKTVVRAMFNHDALPEAMHLPSNQTVLFVQTIAH